MNKSVNSCGLFWREVWISGYEGCFVRTKEVLPLQRTALVGAKYLSPWCPYFPMQKLEKILPSSSSLVKAPVISDNAC